MSRAITGRPAEPAEPVRNAGCALCGYQPEQGGDAQLRLLGTAPIAISVCSDAGACVTRYTSASPYQ